MEGHNDLGLDDLLRFRVEPDLKKRLNEIARQRRKPTAQLLREVLWDIVERETKGQQELALAGANNTAGGGR